MYVSKLFEVIRSKNGRSSHLSGLRCHVNDGGIIGVCSPGFQRLVNVLVGMSGDERKAFLQFTTGCSSLPPGGLANLQPRLTVVRKVDSTDGGYPSVNTCVHYLKLPEYSSEEILRDRLLAATKEKGFHLN